MLTVDEMDKIVSQQLIIARRVQPSITDNELEFYRLGLYTGMNAQALEKPDNEAVNSHQAMKEALERAAQSEHHSHCSLRGKSMDCDCHVWACRKVLTLANGGKL